MSVFIWLALFAAQDPTRDEVCTKDIQSAIADLDSDEYTKSQGAKEELVGIGRRAVPHLVLALRADAAKGSVRLRRLLCEILGEVRLNSDDAVSCLIEKLRDHEEFGTSVASAAAWALGRIGDDRAISPLVESLRSREAETDKLLKYHCILALGMLRVQDAAEALSAALQDRSNTSDDEWGHNLAAAAADALGRIRSKKSADALADLLEKTADADKDQFSGQPLGIHAARALERILGTAHFSSKKGDLYGDTAAISAAHTQWLDWHKANRTRKRVQEIHEAILRFQKDQGKLPDILAHLKDKPANPEPKTWPEGGYYKGNFKSDFKYKKRNDQGGEQEVEQEILYVRPGSGAEFDLYSLGADNQFGGKDADAEIWNHDKWPSAKVEETKRTIEKTVAALRKYYDESQEPKKYPTVLKEVVVKDKEGYLSEDPKDGFGRDLQYKTPGTEGEPFDVISFGLDGKEGGEGADADLWNHDKRPKKENGKSP